MIRSYPSPSDPGTGGLASSLGAHAALGLGSNFHRADIEDGIY
jgi:hypothetical protein